MHYVWEKNQAAALNESRYVVETKETKSALFISAAIREDSAMFSCRAHNNYGQETALIQLVVQGIHICMYVYVSIYYSGGCLFVHSFK